MPVNETFTKFKYPLMLEGQPVEFLDPEMDIKIDHYCPNRAAEIREDVWVYVWCFMMLERAGKTDRIAIMDRSDLSLKEMLRHMFPECTPQIRNYLRRYFGERVVTTAFFHNVWYGFPLDDAYGMPENVDLDSDNFKQWMRLRDLSCHQKTQVQNVMDMTSNQYLGHLRERFDRPFNGDEWTRFHDEVTVEHQKIVHLIEGERLGRPFPEHAVLHKAPLPEGVTWLKNGAELLTEGRAMHHCVASYVEYCLKGDSCIFHVEKNGHKGTLEVDRKGHIKQFKAHCNQQPHEELWHIVHEWLKSHNVETTRGHW